jgi:glucose-6-phosphate 1-dehydrogenase
MGSEFHSGQQVTDAERLAVTTHLAKTSEAPEADAYYCEVPSEPCVAVMFGASGDLARRKLLPALYDLAIHQCLAPRFRLLGFGRTELSDEKFRELATEFLPKSDTVKQRDGARKDFLKTLHYFSGDYGDRKAYEALARRLDDLDAEGRLGGNRLFYLAVPPEVYLKIVENLGAAGLSKPKSSNSWTRVIIEKPFGRDRNSARELNQKVLNVFEESQVYRIDHYLGKETVQNLLVFRFGNGIFEPLWNRNYIDHVQITAAESLGVESRAAFYESAGALRDMIQSHMLQLASLVAMEAPATFDATSVRNEKIKVLQSIRSFTPESIWKSVVRGQYGAGTIDESKVPGYRQEPGVKPNSTTETFVALKLFVDNWRWSGVPFYLRTGKRLAQQSTDVVIRFRRAPHHVFRDEKQEENSLILNIQPDEGISLSFGAKSPGAQMRISPVTMEFSYKQSFGGGSRSAYATLINDCIRGDATLFDRADSVEAAWSLVDPILEAWSTASAPPFPNYPAGSDGPSAAEDLLTTDSRHWRAS